MSCVSTINRSSTIPARVRDAQIEPSRSEVFRLVNDRRSIRFPYNLDDDRLVHTTSKLRAGKRHTVKVMARVPRDQDASKR